MAATRTDFLDEALSSALRQTLEDIEVIVVDDSHPGDAISAIVASHADNRIRYLRNPKNLGPAQTHARALAAARAPFVAILNDDDVWEPNLVEELHRALAAAPDASVAFADHWILRDGVRDPAESDRNSERWGRALLQTGVLRSARDAAVTGAIPIQLAAVFRRAAVPNEPLPEAVGISWDLYLSYLVTREGAAAIYVGKRLASYRTHHSNLSSVGSLAHALEATAAWEMIRADPRFKHVPSLRHRYGRAQWVVATRSLRAGNRAVAARAIARGLHVGDLRALLLVPLLIMPHSVVHAVAKRFGPQG